jgi:hypothetical protein
MSGEAKENGGYAKGKENCVGNMSEWRRRGE